VRFLPELANDFASVALVLRSRIPMSPWGLLVSPDSPTFDPPERRPQIAHGARFIVALTEDSIGERVSIRYLLRGESPTDPNVLMTDVLGHLRIWTDTIAEVVKRDGEVIRIERAKIVAAKVIPPEPKRSRERA
jgi:hypothetical protein